MDDAYRGTKKDRIPRKHARPWLREGKQVGNSRAGG